MIDEEHKFMQASSENQFAGKRRIRSDLETEEDDSLGVVSEFYDRHGSEID